VRSVEGRFEKLEAAAIRQLEIDEDELRLERRHPGARLRERGCRGHLKTFALDDLHERLTGARIVLDDEGAKLRTLGFGALAHRNQHHTGSAREQRAVPCREARDGPADSVARQPGLA